MTLEPHTRCKRSVCAKKWTDRHGANEEAEIKIAATGRPLSTLDEELGAVFALWLLSFLINIQAQPLVTPRYGNCYSGSSP